MLTKTQPRVCIECGLPYGHASFSYHYGQIGNGPAYWSDRGLLCSHACSMAHFERREKEGDPMREPAPNPLEQDWSYKT
jgi:hypothetical protein